MDFADALRAVRDGRRVAREVWAGSWMDGAWLEVVPASVTGGGRHIMEQLLIGYPDGTLRPFAGANWDLLADDWKIHGT